MGAGVPRTAPVPPELQPGAPDQFELPRLAVSVPNLAGELVDQRAVDNPATYHVLHALRRPRCVIDDDNVTLPSTGVSLPGHDG